MVAFSKNAGLFHAEMRQKKDFGLADVYVLATARKLESKVLTVMCTSKMLRMMS